MQKKLFLRHFPLPAAVALMALLFIFVQPDPKSASASPALSYSQVATGEEQLRPLAPVFSEATYQVEVIENIVYGKGLQRSNWEAPQGEPINLQLNAYLPNTPPHRLRPAILLFHGGGFTGGTASGPHMVEIAHYYASRGWAVFSVNYRISEHNGSLPENWPWDPIPAIYPAGRDAKAAVRWLHANADQYHVSRDHITAYGGSAGAMLAIMLGVSDAADYRSEIPVSLDPTLTTTNLEAPANIQTVISFWGASPLLKALEIYDGQYRYDSQDTPTLLVHGTEDTSVPISESEAIYQALTHVGVPVEFDVLVGAGHSAWGATLADGRTIYQAAFDFIVQQQDIPHE